MTTKAPNSEFDRHGLDRLLTVAELSDYLGVPITTIYDWRVDGKGPRGLRIGKHLRFAAGDVETWLSALRENNDAPGAAGAVRGNG